MTRCETHLEYEMQVLLVCGFCVYYLLCNLAPPPCHLLLITHVPPLLFTVFALFAVFVDSRMGRSAYSSLTNMDSIRTDAITGSGSAYSDIMRTTLL